MSQTVYNNTNINQGQQQSSQITLQGQQQQQNNMKQQLMKPINSSNINKYNPATERAYASSNRLNNSSYSLENQKYRDSSIYNHNLSIQIMKEQAFKNREIHLRKKYEGIDTEQLKDLLPNIGNRSTYNIKEVYTRPLSPSTLNKQTYLEIFNSKKDSMRKHLNYINYTNQDYNVVSNNVIGDNDNDVYKNYLVKRLNYESERPQYRDAQNNNFFPVHNQVIAQKILDPTKFDLINQDRKHMRMQMKSHIIKNIKKAKQQQQQMSQRVKSSLGQSSEFSSQYGLSSSVNNSVIDKHSINNNNTNVKSNQNSNRIMNDTLHQQYKSNTQKQSPNNSSNKKEKANFNINNFYKYLENNKNKSVISQRQSDQLPYQKYETLNLIKSSQKQNLQNNNNFQYNNNNETDLYKPKDNINQQNNYQNMDDEIITIMGKQKSIKENAYSDVNITDKDHNYKQNYQYMKQLKDKRKQMNQQMNSGSKYKLSNKNLQQLSRQNNSQFHSSQSARDVIINSQEQSVISNSNHNNSISEYMSNNNSVAYSKRWQNLENYIQNKKSNKSKLQALSHAQSIIQEQSHYQNSDVTSFRSSRQGKKMKNYRARSVIEYDSPLDTIYEMNKNKTNNRKHNEQQYQNMNETALSSVDEITLKDIDQYNEDDEVSSHCHSDYDKNDIDDESVIIDINNNGNQNQGQLYQLHVKQLKNQLQNEKKKREDLEKLLIKLKDK